MTYLHTGLQSVVFMAGSYGSSRMIDLNTAAFRDQKWSAPGLGRGHGTNNQCASAEATRPPTSEESQSRAIYRDRLTYGKGINAKVCTVDIQHANAYV